ncbi:MAG: DmsE family decaheme c-type cytochrome [Nitrospirae bacterium]|nr:DmsE family decaheme c-type cytochrome [Nitrospirota bacterium]
MNFERILTPLIIVIIIISIYQAYNIHAENETPQETPQQAVTEVTKPLPPAENTSAIPPAEGTQPMPTMETSALPPIELTTLIIPKEGAFMIPPPPDRKKGFVGAEKCISCHEKQHTQWSKTIHARWKKSFIPAGKEKEEKRIDCETCHGPGSLHINNTKERLFIISYGPMSKDTREEQNNSCIICHNQGSLFYWNDNMHGKTMTCTECHQVMKNVTMKNLLKQTSIKETCLKCHAEKKSKAMHSPHLSQDEGKMSCSTCHSPHGSDTPGLLRSSSVNENCLSCHSDKRGPYLFDHLPVQENCLLCHDAHSSINSRLLKMRQPYLCLECHTNLPKNLPDNIDAHDVLNPKSRFTYNRGCMNCHPMIHGSRHPSGAGLQR